LCNEYGYVCGFELGGDPAVECRKPHIGAAGDVCHDMSDHTCLPGLVCKDTICQPKLDVGASCDGGLLCNDQLGLVCLPDAGGHARCQMPTVSTIGQACGAGHDVCSGFAFCDGTKCAPASTTTCDPSDLIDMTCLPGLSCSYGTCKTTQQVGCE